MPRMPGATWVDSPASYSSGRPAGPPRLIVIHYTAGSERLTAAEDGAAYDKRRTDGTSTHFFTDGDSITQEVDTDDRAHAALYNGNMFGIQIEQCGTAQSRAQWLDELSRPMITNTARVCAWAMAHYGIPLTRLIDRQVRTGRGLCGHGDITRGWPEDKGTHTDPESNYPWDVLFQDIQAIQSGGNVMDARQEGLVMGKLNGLVEMILNGISPTGTETTGGGQDRIYLYDHLDDDREAVKAAVTSALTSMRADIPKAVKDAVSALNITMSDADLTKLTDKIVAGVNRPTSGTLTGTIQLEV